MKSLKLGMFLGVIACTIFFAPARHANAVSNDHLKYFGYWGDNKSTNGTYKDYTNVVWLNSNQYDTGICGISPGDDKTCQIKDAVAHGQKVILYLSTYLLFADSPSSYANLCDPTITPGCIKDYIGNWNDYKQYIKPYVEDGSIIALYIIDEPVLYYGDRDLVRRGVYDTMYEKLDLVTKLIKQDFPNLPLATTLLPSSIMKLTGEYFPQQVQKPTGEFIPGFEEPLPIPSGFDWLGFDCYSDWNNCYKSGVSIPQLHNALKAKLRPGQKMFLVPDGFLYVDENYKSGDEPSPTKVSSLIGIVNNYYQLAQNDPDVIAIFPYKWTESGKGSYDGFGHLYASGIPSLAARYEEIGREITSPTSPTLSFTVSPTTIDYNTASTLTWIIGGGKVNSCTIGGAWGPLTQSDPQYLSAGTHTQTTGNLKNTSTFTMFCSGPGGVTQTKSATVSIKSNQATNPSPVISYFTASPSSITPGQSTTLSWSTSGAASLSINQGVGNVFGLYNKTVSPAQTTTYILTATNSAGQSVSQTTTVNVLPQYSTPSPPVPPANTPTSTSPVLSNSTSTTALLAQIKYLQAEITRLTELLVKIKNPGSTSHTSSTSIKNNLWFGLKNNQEVVLLQITLAKLGFFKAEATGNFGPATKAAVVAFQKRYNIEPLGGVGSITKAKLNELMNKNP